MIFLDDLLAAIPGSHVQGTVRSREFDAFAYDSRKLRPGELFVAIRSATGDGHDFVAHALQRGAAGALVERPLDLPDHGATIVVVPDVRLALAAWARRIVSRYSPLVVGVAGSVGKTMTQKAIVSVLAHALAGAPVVFDGGSFSSRLGLAMALGGLEPSHQVAVLEMRSSGHGDVQAIMSMVQPAIAVVINAYSDVTPNLTEADVAAETGRLVESLPPTGWAILNGDDPRVLSMRERTRARVITFGRHPSTIADVVATSIRETSEGVRFVLTRASTRDGELGSRPNSQPFPSAGSDSVEVQTRLIGEHTVDAALAAAAVGLARGATLNDIAEGLAAIDPLPGRLRALPGIGGCELIDDTLGSCLPSALAAIAALQTRPAARKIVVLGDLISPGASAEARHHELGRALGEVADYIVLKAESADALMRGALEVGMQPSQISVTHTAADAAASVIALDPREGDVVLLKGLESSRLEHVTSRLLVDPGSAPDVLVRQDAGWRQRVFLSRQRPTWVEIDLSAIGHNVGLIKQMVGQDVEVMVVLKADAYGHGALRVARTALLHGASRIATACLSEAIELRERGIAAPILILGYTPPWQAAEIVRQGLTATVFSLDVARHLSNAAVAQERPAVVHVKVDSGMGRLGLHPNDVAPFIAQIKELPGLEIEGLFTHFATADSADQSYVRYQLAGFQRLIGDLAERGIRFPRVHAANSAATLTLPEARFDMVRLGLAMHGLDPSLDVRCPSDFRRALSFKTQVAQVKEVPAGACVSYGCRFVTERPSRIAVIPVGYGDGFRRSPRNWGEVLVRGKRAPIVGPVCMDMCMIDVTDVPGVRSGDEVILIGRQGGESITAEDVAARLGTINYEVVTQILARVPREVAPTDYADD